jgi:ribosome recycling factor
MAINIDAAKQLHNRVEVWGKQISAIWEEMDNKERNELLIKINDGVINASYVEVRNVTRNLKDKLHQLVNLLRGQISKK